MDVTTVNNEVCVGSLICYLKDLYVSKQENNGPFDPNGRGFELLSEAMKAGELRQELRVLIEVQILVVKLIKQIVEKVEQDGTDEQLVIPTNYMSQSRQIEELFMKIICTTGQTYIYSKNNIINELKAQLLELY